MPQCRQVKKRGEEKWHVHYITTPHHKILALWFMKFSILIDQPWSSLLYSQFVWSMPEWREDEPIKIMHFTIWLIWPNSCPGGQEIYNFDRTFLGHHYYTFSLPGLCQGVEKTILKEKKCIFTILFIGPHLSTRTPLPGVMKCKILVHHSSVIITMHLVSLNHAPEYRRRSYKK